MIRAPRVSLSCPLLDQPPAREPQEDVLKSSLTVNGVLDPHPRATHVLEERVSVFGVGEETVLACPLDGVGGGLDDGKKLFEGPEIRPELEDLRADVLLHQSPGRSPGDDETPFHDDEPVAEPRRPL